MHRATLASTGLRKYDDSIGRARVVDERRDRTHCNANRIKVRIGKRESIRVVLRDERDKRISMRNAQGFKGAVAEKTRKAHRKLRCVRSLRRIHVAPVRLHRRDAPRAHRR